MYLGTRNAVGKKRHSEAGGLIGVGTSDQREPGKKVSFKRSGCWLEIRVGTGETPGRQYSLLKHNKKTKNEEKGRKKCYKFHNQAQRLLTGST